MRSKLTKERKRLRSIRFGPLKIPIKLSKYLTQLVDRSKFKKYDIRGGEGLSLSKDKLLHYNKIFNY